MIIIANWKQNKTYLELNDWMESFSRTLTEKAKTEASSEIIIAPSYPIIFPLKMVIQGKYPFIKIAAQNISVKESGPYTGEIGAFQLGGLAEYVIIGHSERRRMGETLEDVKEKIKIALKEGIIPIVCFSKKEDGLSLVGEFSNKKVLFAYEPENAISTAENSSGPLESSEIIKMVDELGQRSVIYGGSVDKDSIDNYLNLESISGFLVGSASLDPINFAEIVNKIIK